MEYDIPSGLKRQALRQVKAAMKEDRSINGIVAVHRTMHFFRWLCVNNVFTGDFASASDNAKKAKYLYALAEHNVTKPHGKAVKAL
jgi:hypothetical protein